MGGLRTWRRGLLVAAAATLLAACGGGASGGGGGTPTLNWYIFHEPSGSFAAAAASCSAASGGEYTIQIRELPSAADGQREQLVRRVRDPQAFLMDEPLSNLDAKLRVQMRTTVARLQNQLGTTTVYVTHDQTEAMTLGDRVAVMRAGVIQQVGAPEELYQRPRNLFVAGFIGSPAMNFLPGTLADGRLRTALGDVELPADVDAKVRRAGAGRDLIVGIRPEHFEDAALVDGHRAEGRTFSAVVDVLESLGADKYAYFRLQGARATAQELEELAADAGTGDAPGGGGQVVARLDPASQAREGQPLRLWFDPGKLHLFNPANGAHLTL